jgi:hypothetical protein
MKKRFWVMLVLSLLVIGLLSSCVSAPVEEENNDNTTNTETFDGGLIVNGDFSENVLGDDEKSVDFKGWFKFTPAPADWNGWASSEATILNGEGKVTVNNPGSDTWTIQLAQWVKGVEPGKTYILKFNAKSTATNPSLKVVVTTRSNTDENGWSTNPMSKEFTLSSNFSETPYEFEFSMPEEFNPDDATVKVGFELGLSPAGEYYFDDVSVKEKQ